MIHSLSEKATTDQVREMLDMHGDMIKIVVDIRRGFLAGGGEMHADCEEVLLDQGCEQDDLWGANWFPGDQHIEFESLINIRPRAGNRSTIIQNEEIRQQVEKITRQLLGGIL
jgi:hypothetical protein